MKKFFWWRKAVLIFQRWRFFETFRRQKNCCLSWRAWRPRRSWDCWSCWAHEIRASVAKYYHRHRQQGSMGSHMPLESFRNPLGQPSKKVFWNDGWADGVQHVSILKLGLQWINQHSQHRSIFLWILKKKPPLPGYHSTKIVRSSISQKQIDTDVLNGKHPKPNI